jgi:hypothetical protein
MSTWTFGTYTRTLADTYFSTNTENEAWTSYSTTQRDNAVTEAETIIWSILTEGKSSSINWYPLSLTIRHPDDIKSTDRIREDKAIYHQALWLLLNTGSNPNAEKTGPKWEMSNELDDDAAEHPQYFLGPMVHFYLGVRQVNPRISR